MNLMHTSLLQVLTSKCIKSYNISSGYKFPLRHTHTHAHIHTLIKYVQIFRENGKIRQD